MAFTINVTYENDDNEEVVLTLPAKNEVCWRCEGFGCHLTPSIGEHAYTPEEFNESFDDEESRSEYFKRGGMYDVTCEECHGKNVLSVIDEENIPANLKDQYAEFCRFEERQAQFEAEDRATERMERMMGC